MLELAILNFCKIYITLEIWEENDWKGVWQADQVLVESSRGGCCCLSTERRVAIPVMLDVINRVCPALSPVLPLNFSSTLQI